MNERQFNSHSKKFVTRSDACLPQVLAFKDVLLSLIPVVKFYNLKRRSNDDQEGRWPEARSAFWHD